jgi:hypothetical protein
MRVEDHLLMEMEREPTVLMPVNMVELVHRLKQSSASHSPSIASPDQKDSSCDRNSEGTLDHGLNGYFIYLQRRSDLAHQSLPPEASLANNAIPSPTGLMIQMSVTMMMTMTTTWRTLLS